MIYCLTQYHTLIWLIFLLLSNENIFYCVLKNYSKNYQISGKILENQIFFHSPLVKRKFYFNYKNIFTQNEIKSVFQIVRVILKFKGLFSSVNYDIFRNIHVEDLTHSVRLTRAADLEKHLWRSLIPAFKNHKTRREGEGNKKVKYKESLSDWSKKSSSAILITPYNYYNIISTWFMNTIELE